MSDPVQDRLQKLKGDPVAARLARLKNPGTVTLGPVETLGTSQEERTRALTQAAAGGDIAASLELAQSQSNLPAMARSQEAIRPTAAGTAANIFFSDVLSPVFPKTAALGTEMAIDRFTESGGDAAANADLFGLASAGGAVAGNYGLMRALPNAPGLAPGMSLKEIGQRLLYAGAVEGGQGAAIAGGGALAEGATPEEAARFAAKQFAIQGMAGAAFRALPEAFTPTGAIRSAIRGDQYYPEGRVGRVVREIPPNSRPILSSEELLAKYPEPFQGVYRTPMEMAEVQLRRQIETDPIPPPPRTGEPATPGVRRYTPEAPRKTLFPTLDEAGTLGKRGRLSADFVAQNTAHGGLERFGDVGYRESDAEDFLDALQRTDPVADRSFLATSPDLALGQGKNRGIVAEYDLAGLQGRPNVSKPAWRQVAESGGGVELVARLNKGDTYRRNLRRVTIQPELSLDRFTKTRLNGLLRSLEAEGWTKNVRPDGGIDYSRPASTSVFANESGALGRRVAGESESPLALPSDPEVNLRPAPRTGEPATPGVRRYIPEAPRKTPFPTLDETGATGRRRQNYREPLGQKLTVESGRPREVGEAAIQEFGETQSPLLGGYLLSDGRWVDFSEGSGERITDHRSIERIFTGQDPARDSRFANVQRMMDEGHARTSISQSRNGQSVNIDLSRPLTSGQVSKIRSAMVDGGRRNELSLDFTVDGEVVASVYRDNVGASELQGALDELYAKANGGEAGAGAPRLLASTTGGIGGAAYGYATGETPEERRRRAWVFGLGGLAAGYATGAAAETIGARGTAGVAEQATEALSRGAQTAERMERRGPQMSQRRTEFAVAPARERLVPNLTAGDSPAYVNLTKFGLEADAQKRLAEEATRVGVELQGDPRRRATWNEWREAAKSLGVSDIVRKDAQALDQTDLLATRNLIAGNTDRLIELDTQLADPTLTAETRSRVALEQQALDAQNAILLEKFIPARTAAGRRLNSLKIIASRTLDPAWWLGKAQDVKGSPLTDIEAAQVRKFLTEQNRIGLVQFVSGIRPATLGEKAVTYWKANLLTNPRTHAVNATSNTVVGGLEVVKDVPGALADQLMSLATGRRTTGLPSVRQMTAAAEGAREGFRQAKLVMRGVPMAEDLAKYDIPREINFDNPVLDGYTKFVFRSLGASDRIFRMAAVRRSLANQAEVLARTEGLKGTAFKQRVESLLAEPTTEMSVRAMSEAEQAVFQDETQVGKALGAIGRFAPGGVPVGEFVMPFRRTPGAVATRIGEYTLGLPAGLAKISARAAKGELAGMSPEDQKQLATLLGRGATGASLIAAGYLLGTRGLLTPPSADWSSDRNQAQTDAMRGVQGNSITIGDTQLDIGRLSPVGNLLAIGAMAAQAANDRDPETSPWAAGALGMVKTVANQPFLQGLEQVQEAVKDPARAGTRVAEGVAKGFVPASSAMGAAARVVDPTVRRRDGVVDAVAGQVPGVSQGFPEQFDPLGRPVQREGGWQGAVSQVILPTAIQTKRHSQVLDALGEYGVTLGGFKPEQGESNEAFAARAQASGAIREEELEKAIRSPAWAQDTSYEGRQALLEAAKRKAASRIAKVKRDNAKPDPVADRLRQLRTP